MGSKRVRHRTWTRAGLVTAGIGIILAATGIALNPAAAHHDPARITLCHATSSDVTPYRSITVSSNAVDGSGGGGDHANHDEPRIWDPTLKAAGLRWGDIIPPTLHLPAGLNWTPEGQAIFNNGCRATAAAPLAAAVQCVGGVPGIVLTLTNGGTATASFAVTQTPPGGPVAGSPFAVTGMSNRVVNLPQTEDIPTTIDVSSGTYSTIFSFDSNCDAGGLAPPNPSAAAIECVATPAGGIAIQLTLSNTGGADAVVAVNQDGAAVPGSAFTIPAGGVLPPILLPQVEDTATQILVFDGLLFSIVFDFASDCAPPAPLPVPDPSAFALECVPGIALTLVNDGLANASFSVTQDGGIVPGSPFLVAGLSNVVVPLPQVEDTPTQIVVTSVAYIETFDFDSDCVTATAVPTPPPVPPRPTPPPPPPPPVPSAPAPTGSPEMSASLQCAADGFRVTIINAGSADGSVNVTDGGTSVAEDLAVLLGESAQVDVTVAEGAAYDIAVTAPGGPVGAFSGTRDCVDVGGVVIPRPAAPVQPTAPEQPAPSQVAGNVVRQELPRTGAGTLELVQLGLGLVLVGAGIVVASREPQLQTA